MFIHIYKSRMRIILVFGHEDKLETFALFAEKTHKMMNFYWTSHKLSHLSQAEPSPSTAVETLTFAIMVTAVVCYLIWSRHWGVTIQIIGFP